MENAEPQVEKRVGPELLDEHWLSRAEIVDRSPLGMGLNKPDKIKLEFDGKKMNAIFKAEKKSFISIDVKGKVSERERVAYLVSETLGWDLVPATVLREVGDDWGSVQMFVDEAEEMRDLTKDKQVETDDLVLVDLFDFCLGDTDRNKGNLIKDKNGKLWAIDNSYSVYAKSNGRIDFLGEERTVGLKRSQKKELFEKIKSRVNLTEDAISDLEGRMVGLFEGVETFRDDLIKRIKYLRSTLGEVDNIDDLYESLKDYPSLYKWWPFTEEEKG